MVAFPPLDVVAADEGPAGEEAFAGEAMVGERRRGDGDRKLVLCHSRLQRTSCHLLNLVLLLTVFDARL